MFCLSREKGSGIEGRSARRQAISGVEVQFHSSLRSKRLCLIADTEKTIQQCHNNGLFQFNSWLWCKMSRKCVNSAVNFCYTCSQVTLKSQKRTITPLIKKAYSLYFDGKIRDQDKLWGPHICCISCVAGLTSWLKHKRSSMGFAIPMIWREPSNHVTDCYFSMTTPITHGISKKKRLS